MRFWAIVKVLLLVCLIAGFGLFMYLEIQVMGNPGSQFNQTTRFVLGKHPVLRTLFRLHNYSDARGEYFAGLGPIVIYWFKPATLDVDAHVMQKFGDSVSNYTGRTTQVNYGGDISEGKVEASSLDVFEAKAQGTKFSGSSFFVFFTQDYLNRQEHELSTTYKESGIILSLDAHKQFTENYPEQINSYLLSSLLHEFGHQLGLEHNDTAGCIMNVHAGIDYQPLSAFGQTVPEDYCQLERDQLNNLKLNFVNN